MRYPCTNSQCPNDWHRTPQCPNQTDRSRRAAHRAVAVAPPVRSDPRYSGSMTGTKTTVSFDGPLSRVKQVVIVDDRRGGQNVTFFGSISRDAAMTEDDAADMALDAFGIEEATIDVEQSGSNWDFRGSLIYDGSRDEAVEWVKQNVKSAHGDRIEAARKDIEDAYAGQRDRLESRYAEVAEEWEAVKAAAPTAHPEP